MRRGAWLPAAVFAFTVLVRAGIAAFTGFDGLYGQDPYAYYDYSRQLHDALVALQSPPPFFWPLGYPFPAALTMIAVGLRPLAGQIVSIAGGAAAAAFVCWLIADHAGRFGIGALVGGLLIATAAQATISSLSVMSDALGIGWAAFSAWAMLRYCRTLSLRWLAVAAFGLGGAVLTRWIFGLLAPSFALAALLAWRRESLSLRQIAGACALAVLVGGAVVGSQFAVNLDEAGSHTGDLQVVGWNPANAFLSTVHNSDGVFYYERPIGLYYALPPLHPAFVFPLLTPFLLFGLWTLRRPPWSPLALLAVWPLAIYIFLAGIAWENPRFSLALFPPLAALAGIGLEAAWDSLREPRWQAGMVALCVLGLIGSLAWTARDLRAFVGRKNDDLAAARYADEQLPAGAVTLTFGLTETLKHYTDLKAVELYNETPESLHALACGGAEAFVYVDVANIEGQWAGKSPDVNLRWLRKGIGLMELGREGPWTLYAIQGSGC